MGGSVKSLSQRLFWEAVQSNLRNTVPNDKCQFFKVKFGE